MHSELANLELSLGIQTDEFQEDLNFSMVHVVYEWASNKVIWPNPKRFCTMFFACSLLLTLCNSPTYRRV